MAVDDKKRAVLWLADRRCRILLYDGDKVIDANDMWNNRASAESMIRAGYPTIPMEFVRFTEEDKVKQMNEAWDLFHVPKVD